SNRPWRDFSRDQTEMLYWLFYEKLFHVFTPFRVFGYATFRTAFASLTALFLCVALGPWLIAKLREFQIGQYIREEGPQSHQKKAGTPTMGGVLIIISIVVPTLLWADLTYGYVWIAIAALLGFGWIGFLDDYAKITNRRNLGLTGTRKLIYQFSPAFAVAARFCIFVALVVVFVSNAVNLTDGLDGLAIGLMVVAAGALTVLAYAGGHA